MMLRVFAFVLAVLAASGAVAEVCASAGSSREVPRTLLALYDGSREASPGQTRIHRFVEFPLNHLGYAVRYLDVSRADLLAPLDPAIAGIVSWFDAPLAGSDTFAGWMASARGDCPDALSLIVLGDTGLAAQARPDAAAETYLRRLGLGWDGTSVYLGDLATVANVDDTLFGYETDFSVQPGRSAALRALAPQDAALSVLPAGQTSGPGVDLVVLHGPNAYVHESALLDTGDGAGAFWIADPFALFGRVLARETPHPVADLTTLLGRRIYFETVGPEGWLAPAPARTFDAAARLGSENLLDALIAPYPQLPVTVSVVTGDLDPALGGRPAETGLRIARAVFDLPQTAAASSGRSLVRDWSAVSGISDAAGPDPDVAVDPSGGLLGHLQTGLREVFFDPRDSAEPQPSDGVRQYAQDPFVLADETTEAISRVRTIASASREPVLFLWSGDAAPSPEARAAVAAADAPALGGGQMSIERSFSISGMSPVLRADDGPPQVYHALPGDLGNTGYPSGNADELHGLERIVEATDQPRRLKPFQLAYSAGSANPFASRSAVARLKDRAIASGTIPIFADRYVAMATAFPGVRVRSEGAGRWRILDRGPIQTMRFDTAAGLSADLGQSVGVLGARRVNDALYVALAPAVDAPLIVLAETDAASGMVVPSGHIGLVDSNLELSGMSRRDCRWTLTGTGWGPGQIRFQGDPGERYFAVVQGSDTDPASAVADASGVATLAVDTRQGRPETVTVYRLCED